MSDTTPSTNVSDTGSHGRGRGRARGGLGKYLRARGRGHRGGGRPAQFGKRLLLEGEEPLDDEDEELISERAQKYSRRQLGTNLDRYKDEEPELGSDGVHEFYLVATPCILMYLGVVQGNLFLNPK
jgi:hypothetical protein